MRRKALSKNSTWRGRGQGQDWRVQGERDIECQQVQWAAHPLILQSYRKAQSCLSCIFCCPEPRPVPGTRWAFDKERLDLTVSDTVRLLSEVEGALHQKNTDIFKELGKSLKSGYVLSARCWALPDCPVNSHDLQGRHHRLPSAKEETKMERILVRPQVTKEGPELELRSPGL